MADMYNVDKHRKYANLVRNIGITIDVLQAFECSMEVEKCASITTKNTPQLTSQ